MARFGGVHDESVQTGVPMITQESGLVHEVRVDVTAYLDNPNIFLIH